MSSLNPDDDKIIVEARVVGFVKVDPNDYLNVDHAKLIGADYSKRKVRMFTTVGSRFEKCRFEGTRIDNVAFGAGMELSEFIDCSFDGARMENGGGFSRFVRCSFQNVEIRGWRCYEAEFIECVFTGRLTECIFNGTVREQDRAWVGREKNEFRGNDFSGCDLVDVGFRTGIDLTHQELPSGPEYLYLPDAAAAIERAQRTVQQWYDPTLRERGLSLLETLQLGTDTQKQRLLRADNYYGIDPREVVDGVFAALRG